MARIYKKGREISDARIASNSFVAVVNELVSVVWGFLVKSDVAATTPLIAGICKTDATFAADNQTVNKDKAVFVTAADDLRVELNTVTDLADTNVWEKFDINAAQWVILTASGTQVELVEVLDARVGSFKIMK